jgi:predicted DNA-binding transcriptional regulator AlpA
MAIADKPLAADTDTRRMVNEHEAARLLGLSISMVRFWRRQHEGPRYRKLGRRVLYQVADIDDFIAALPAGGSKTFRDGRVA